jgi:hypothetical protein
MKEKAGGLSSRHRSTQEFNEARAEAVEKLISLGILIRDRHRLFLVRKVKRGEERVPVSVHRTKGLLLLPRRVSADPVSLIPERREGQ